MGMRILLLSPVGDIRQVYCNELSMIGINADVVATFRELYDSMAQNSYNGIVLDLNTKLKSSREENNLVRNILENFPVAELRWDSDTNKIGTYYQGQHKEGGNLEDFVNRICRFFDARKISTEKRIDLNLCVMLARSDDFKEENIEKTISINISEGGCHIFSKDKWEIGDAACFIFKELSDQTPIRGKVRWFTEWGKGIQPPGIGIKYEQVKEEQIIELIAFKQTEARGEH